MTTAGHNIVKAVLWAEVFTHLYPSQCTGYVVRTFNDRIMRQETEIMPRKAQRTRKDNGFDKYWFVRTRLNASDKDAFEAWSIDHSEALEEMLIELATDGCKMSLSWDASNDCYIASHTQNDPQHVNAFGVLTSRAPNPLEAVLLNCYKHFVLMADGEWPNEGGAAGWG